MKKKIYLFIIVFWTFLIVNMAHASVWDFFSGGGDSLKVKGNEIYLNDNKILLRGVAMGEVFSRQIINKRTVADYEEIKKNWNSNFVRISIYPGVYKSDEKSVKRILEEEVEAARKQGLIVMVDWHVIGFPDGWYKEWEWGGYYGYSYDSKFKTSEDFWKYMAVKYRKDPGVVFELWNEPADKNMNRDWEQLRPYMQQLYSIIRGNGANNIVVAPGLKYTFDLKGVKKNPLEGSNIAYAWHVYPFSNNYGINWHKAVDSLFEKYPVVVSEWGFKTDKNSVYYAPNSWADGLKSFILSNRLNFTAWCWHNPWDPRMFSDNKWTQLTDYGKYVKDLLFDIKDFESIEKLTDEFVNNGIDYNSKTLGKGERKAVVYSFQKAFERMPVNYNDYNDVLKIVDGHWPTQRSEKAENRAKESFRFIYEREADMGNPNDDAAITVMAYGLRQRAENRNLNSEKQGLSIFALIFGKMPNSTEEWNILQAITYSGATR